MEVLDKVSTGCGLSGLLEVYNDQGYSDYLVVYLRFGSCHWLIAQLVHMYRHTHAHWHTVCC